MELQVSTENEDEIRSGRTIYEIDVDDLAIPIPLAPCLCYLRSSGA